MNTDKQNIDMPGGDRLCIPRLRIGSKSMKLERSGEDEAGFSRVDLVVVVLGLLSIALLLSLFLPALPVRRDKLSCLYQLQQIGQDCRYYANTHDGKLRASNPANDHAPSIEQVYYQTIGSRLPVSHMVCPQDTRTPASDWKTLKTTNISYFLSANAAFNDPSNILAGDRNVSISAQETFTWNSTLGLHGDHGNLVFADGHVERDVSSIRLDRLFHQGRNPTNGLLVP